jgi:polyhydroxybutyrate depolymerase
MRKIFSPQAGGARAWLDLADREGFLLIVPNGVNPKTGDTKGDTQNWNDLRPAGDDRPSEADDVDFIVQLLDKTAREFDTDTARVYVTGASNGGMMAYRLLIEAPERFAAAATFIAVLPDDLPDIKPPGKATPLLIANGTKDPLVKWEGGAIRGQRGRMMSVLESRDWWIQANRADVKDVEEESLPDADVGDGCRLYSSLYPATPGGAAVLFLKIDGGGHALPSLAHELPDTFLVRSLIGPLCRDAEGAEIAWRFMAQFKR